MSGVWDGGEGQLTLVFTEAVNYLGGGGEMQWFNGAGAGIQEAAGTPAGDGTTTLVFESMVAGGTGDPLTLTIPGGVFETVAGSVPFPGVDGFVIT